MLEVQVVTPERILFTGEATMVVARTGGGDIAFLTGHAAFLGTLAIWPVRVKLDGGGEESFAVHGGFVEVSRDTVSVLSDVAEAAGQIDVERARRAKARAETAVREAGTDEDALRDAEAALARADVRLVVAGVAQLTPAAAAASAAAH
jgi:F-type H+-transporting ATPase subunit epsilon